MYLTLKFALVMFLGDKEHLNVLRLNFACKFTQIHTIYKLSVVFF